MRSATAERLSTFISHCWCSCMHLLLYIWSKKTHTAFCCLAALPFLRSFGSVILAPYMQTCMRKRILLEFNLFGNVHVCDAWCMHINKAQRHLSVRTLCLFLPSRFIVSYFVHYACVCVCARASRLSFQYISMLCSAASLRRIIIMVVVVICYFFSLSLSFPLNFCFDEFGFFRIFSVAYGWILNANKSRMHKN